MSGLQNILVSKCLDLGWHNVWVANCLVVKTSGCQKKAQLINDKAVCRIALATLGLLIEN